VDGDALLRIREPKGNLEWLIRKDGCMHCEDPGCLKACPSPGAIVQYTNGIVDFHQENCIGCGYCVAGCPFDVPRISSRTAGVQVHAVLGPRGGGPGAGLRQDLPDRRHHVRHQGGHEGARGGAHRGPEVARLRTPACTTRPASAART
jgi:Fe-S-cluster-containing dehydrogenase component